MKKGQESPELSSIIGLVLAIFLFLVFGAILFDYFFNQSDVFKQFDEFTDILKNTKPGQEGQFVFDLPENYAIIGFNRIDGDEPFKSVNSCYQLEVSKIKKPYSRKDCSVTKNCLCICPIYTYYTINPLDPPLGVKTDCADTTSKCVELSEYLKGTGLLGGCEKTFIPGINGDLWAMSLLRSRLIGPIYYKKINGTLIIDDQTTEDYIPTEEEYFSQFPNLKEENTIINLKGVNIPLVLNECNNNYHKEEGKEYILFDYAPNIRTSYKHLGVRIKTKEGESYSYTKLKEYSQEIQSKGVHYDYIIAFTDLVKIVNPKDPIKEEINNEIAWCEQVIIKENTKLSKDPFSS